MNYFLKYDRLMRILFLLCYIHSFAQVDFKPVPNSTLSLRGDLQIIGNSIVGLDQGLDDECKNCTTGPNCVVYKPNEDYNGICSNNGRNFGYIDIDNDPNTFSSSSADFMVPSGCQKIAYAGLYWAASYFVERDTDGNAMYNNLPLPDNRPDFKTIKIKPPRATDYITISDTKTQVIYNGYRNSATNPEDVAVKDVPYVCYADVTSIIGELDDPTGTYTIANMRAATGLSGGNTNGISGGWVLVIAYEDPSLSAKYISTVNGYLHNQPCGGTPTPECLKEFTYEGFKTVPAPLQVNARYAIASLEGDAPYIGDVFQIKRPDGGLQDIFTSPANPSINFFDSSISVDGQYVTTRKPASQNTLGFDADIFEIPNPSNSVLGNDQNSATFYTTSEGDAFSIFFNALCIEIVEPELTVVERVLDRNGIDITGEEVGFGDQLFYELTIENQGNEDIINARISDVLPGNVEFIPNSITVSNPGIVATINTTDAQIEFDIDDALVVKNGGIHTIRFGVQVVSSCEDLLDACSNEIHNIAVATYTGLDSYVTFTGEKSISGKDECGYDIKGSANILISEGVCFSETQVIYLCSGEVDLIAGAGFSNYQWVEQSKPDIVIGTDQTLTVNEVGNYHVTKTGGNNCQDFVEIFEVNSYEDVNNPIVDIVANLVSSTNVSGSIDRICPVNGEILPELFLCGSETTFTMNLDFVEGAIMEWQRLDPSNCTSITRDSNCPTSFIDGGACENDWVTLGTGSDFIVNESGEYRVQVTIDGTCSLQFFFNVFKNTFEPTVEVIDNIVCGNPGSMHILNASSKYEYELIAPSGVSSGYQTSAIFTGLTESGVYAVNTRLIGDLTEACVFQNTATLLDLDIDINLTSIGSTCSGELGTIDVEVTGSQTTYIYTLTNTTTGAITTSASTILANYTFTELTPDTYIVEVQSTDGACTNSETITIDTAPELVAAVSLAKDLSCNPNYQPNPFLNDPSHPDYDPTALPYDPNPSVAIYEVMVSGGSGNYAFNNRIDFFGTSLEPISISGTQYRFIANTDGDFPVYVEDLESQCIVFAGSIAISSYDPIIMDASVETEAICYGESAVINVMVTSGIPPFIYTFNDEMIGPTNNMVQSFSVDPTTSYTVSVSDAFGCNSATVEIIPENVPPILTDVQITQPTSTILGSVEVSATGGTPPYQYSINNGTSVTSNIFNNLEGGVTYTIRVEDNNGCWIDTNATIDPFVEELSVALDTSLAQIMCYGDASASINAIATGGTGEYSYVVTGADFLGNTVIVGPVNESSFNFLSAGSYQYTVADSESRTISVDFQVTQPEELVTSAIVVTENTCGTSADGSISVTVTGGMPPYSYSLVDVSTAAILSVTQGAMGTYVFSNLMAGTYTVEVIDSYNCLVAPQYITVSEPTPIIANISIEPLTLSDDAIVTVIASGGDNNFTYEVLEANSLSIITPLQTSNIITLDTAGNYLLKIQDSNGCEVLEEFTISPLEQHPILEYAEEIFICTLTGQSYPTVSIENEDGEPLEISAIEGATIVWQKLDDITCTIELENDCPTEDSSCSSSWFDIATGSSCSVIQEGQYRIVVSFVTKNSSDTKVYYFRAEKKALVVNDDVVMYPNPGENMIYVNTDVHHIQVFDAVGKQVLTTNQNSYDIQQLEKGIYFTIIKTKNGQEHIIKLMKE